jgi:glycosyltransferase involved in cell wall biosynthesis
MGNNEPRVTIGLPVYNGIRFLDQAIESILGQTFQEFELIVSDNASTDGTSELCHSYAQKDSRIRYYRQDENVGAAKNYNHLVELARGEYFKWAAHDDICAPPYLEKCVEVLDENSTVVLCYPKTHIIDEEGNDKGEYRDALHLESPRRNERFRDALFRDSGECNAVFGLMRLSVLKATALIGNYQASDNILLSELSLHGNFHELSEPLFLRRDHPLTSARANVTAGERAAWFDPRKNKDKVHMVRWRWAVEYSRAIRRAKTGAGEGLRCYRHLGKWIRWNRNHLAHEIGRAVNRRFSQTR